MDGGATFLQIRAKHTGPAEFLRICDDILAAADTFAATVIVNDRVDLALISGADGVHVGQDDLAPAAARDILGPEAIVGYSTHTIEQIEAAVGLPVSYLAVGPVFGTTTKATGYDAVGLDRVRAARQATGKPVVAIGGVTLDNAESAVAAGATMVAVIGDLLTGGNPTARVRDYLARFQPARF